MAKISEKQLKELQKKFADAEERERLLIIEIRENDEEKKRQRRSSSKETNGKDSKIGLRGVGKSTPQKKPLQCFSMLTMTP
jgi:hypothetical protein